MNIEKLCTELLCNIVAKRHANNGQWDMRIIHPWIHQPILSVTGKSSMHECLEALNARLPALQGQAAFIQKKNAERTKHFAKQEQHTRHQFDPFDWQ
jgi:hypothetical protein